MPGNFALRGKKEKEKENLAVKCSSSLAFFSRARKDYSSHTFAFLNSHSLPCYLFHPSPKSPLLPHETPCFPHYFTTFNTAMDQTQSFCLVGTTAIVEIPTQHIDGQNVGYWENIERLFPGVRYVRNGEVSVTVEKDSEGQRLIPSRILHCPKAVLDVVLSTAVDHIHAAYSAAPVPMGLGDAADGASNADEAVDALQVTAVGSVSEARPSFQPIVKLASKKAQVFEIEQQLIASLDPAIQKTVQASLRARNMSVQAHNDGRMEDYERHRNESEGHFQEMKEIMAKNAEMAAHTATLMLAKQDELKATIEQLETQGTMSMQELNAKQDEIKQL
ncbi:unnamed protein product [Mortierella alpina]